MLNMSKIFDVADWFLSKEAMTPKKLQKLCYYYKAWGLALYNEDLLPEDEFEAWVHGPVNRVLYTVYKNYFWNDIAQKPDNSHLFNERELDLLESVWLTYGELTANAIEALTHTEAPWRNARSGLTEFAHCTRIINHDDMRDYYRKEYAEYQGE